MKYHLSLIITLLLLPVFGPVSAADKQPPEYTAGGLKLVPDSELALVYMDPDADFSVYHSILLVQAQVAFRKDWQRDKNLHGTYRVTDEDVVRIRKELSAEFGEIFTKRLEDDGNVLVDLPAEGVLIVRPAIVDLDINSPSANRATRVRSLKQSAGEMTLYLELIDSISGDILAKALDLKYDRSKVMTQFDDSFRNEKAAQKILESWAETFVKGLAEARAATPGD